MADFKQHKGNENKVHEQLHGNLFLLSQYYRPSKDFYAVFKKDMFVKNNKAAFFEVIYYLLNVLNPNLTKEKLPSWPPYDIKRENKFRSEVHKYVNELNSLYENADIPHIMPSHFISPGGFKFTRFMLKLSQLVMYEHLKKSTETDILLRPKPSKNNDLTKINLANLKKKTCLIQCDTNNMIKEFQNFHFDCNEKAIVVDNKLKKLNEYVRTAKKENAKIKEEFNENYPNYPSVSVLEEKINKLRCQYEGIQEIQQLFIECEQLISHLNSNKLVLEHCKGELKLPNEVLHIVKNGDELDLIEFFQGLYSLLKHKALEFSYPTGSSVSLNKEKLKKLSLQYNEMNNNLLENIKELQITQEKMSQQFKLLVDCRDETEEILAVPLSELEK